MKIFEEEEKLCFSRINVLFNKGFMIIQFLLALVFIICTLMIYSQIGYMRKQNLGFNTDQIVVIKSPLVKRDSAYFDKLRIFKSNLLTHSNVSNVSISSEVPGNQLTWNKYFRSENSIDVTGESIPYINIDYDFIDTYDLKLVAGKNYSRDYSYNEESIIINIASLNLLKMNDAKSAIDRQLRENKKNYNILGVLENFHQEFLKKEITSVVFFLDSSHRRGGWISIKLNKRDCEETITFIKDRWAELFPECPMEFFNLDKFFDRQYDDDRRFNHLLGIFTLIVILFSGLSILGLLNLNIEKYNKEIESKNAKSSKYKTFLILSKDIVKILLAAIVLSFPISYLLISNWLDNFAYHIEIFWWMFIISGLFFLLITLMFVSLYLFISKIQNSEKMIYRK
jgi:putative ABC transport system permease protein